MDDFIEQEQIAEEAETKTPVEGTENPTEGAEESRPPLIKGTTDRHVSYILTSLLIWYTLSANLWEEKFVKERYA